MCQVLSLTPNTTNTKRKMLTTSWTKSSSSHRALSWAVVVRAVPWRPGWLVWTICSSHGYLVSSMLSTDTDAKCTLHCEVGPGIQKPLGQVLPGFYYSSFQLLKWLANNLTLWNCIKSFQNQSLLPDPYSTPSALKPDFRMSTTRGHCALRPHPPPGYLLPEYCVDLWAQMLWRSYYRSGLTAQVRLHVKIQPLSAVSHMKSWL